MPQNIAIIGAGIIGLSTACKIQEDIPGCQLTIFYDECSPNTTGDISAGLVCPYQNGNDEEDQAIYVRETLKHLRVLYNRQDAFEIGISKMSGFIIGGNIIKPNAFKEFPNFRKASEAECHHFLRDTKERPVYTLTTWICECTSYLPWLIKSIELKGGKLIKKHISSFEDLSDFDIIINCAGIGAKFLTSDKELYPVKGQVYAVEAPWIKHFYLFGNNYIIPRLTDVVIGGTKQYDNYNLEVDEKDSDQIWSNCCKFEPSLRYSKIKSQHVGLRPKRTSIRIELEQQKLSGRTVTILHNYGHGGSGVSMH
uniref:D-aspartate oxidase-like n=1 Tax=Ciona intestinalis TaxID=7719 RepID=UPI00089DAFD1|nr:D-aspartate oxidase-like [Ciona intestinalis]|eukprot:XP_018667703.1 D-aspartate oxidase-like [Ciona intestinalis]